MTNTDPTNNTPEIISRKLTEEERYFYEQSYKEPVESIARIEEAAKFLVGATATTSGLFLAAFKISYGNQTAAGILWRLPFICWAISIITLVCVLLPQKYKVGKREPASWKKAFLKARKRKFIWLFAGACFFILGIILAFSHP
ncbi:MFS transporter [Candidatus Magnetomoraceae bacterium gMMP-15]